MHYDVRALSSDHLISHLTIEGRDEQDVRRQVELRGLFAAEIRPSAKLAGRGRLGRHWSLILFSQELLALMTAGLSIVEGLEALSEKEANDGVRAILQQLLAGLRDGKRFSAVLAEQPYHFPPLYIGIVRAAEGTSDLPRSLARYLDYRKRSDSVRSKVVSATIYPAFLALVGGGVSFFLMFYVVPKFAQVYQEAGRSLPLASRLVMEWGRFATAHSALLLACLAGLAATTAVIARELIRRGGVTRLVAMIPAPRRAPGP